MYLESLPALCFLSSISGQVDAEGKLQALYCGQEATDTESVPSSQVITSPRNFLSLLFVSDFSNEELYTGFRAHYSAEGALITHTCTFSSILTRCAPAKCGLLLNVKFKGKSSGCLAHNIKKILATFLGVRATQNALYVRQTCLQWLHFNPV